MRRAFAIAVAAAAAVAVGAAGGAGAAETENPKLFASVGPGFAISLKDASGAAVTHLDPGTYDIAVDDKADEHNFHLTGPGVDKTTSVAEIVSTTWTVAFVDGTYHFQCDPHASFLKGSFTVGSGGGGGGGGGTTPPPPGKLVGTVGPGYTISLTKGGRAAKTLKAGRYDVIVRDRATTHNFHLVGPGVNRRTGVAFKGTVTWKVKLGKGTLRFLCDPHKTRQRGSVKVVAP